jgi:hypothetical protein
MKEIEGHICIANVNSDILLYGPNQGRGSDHWESLITNGLSTFENVLAAEVALEEVKSKEGVESNTGRISRLRLKIAETREELDYITNEEGYVVLRIDNEWNEIKLYGPRTNVRMLPGVLPCVPLNYNGLQPFPNLELAINAAQELTRQSGLLTRVAAFSIEQVE